MLVGKYDLFSLYDGRYELRFEDKKLKKHFRKVFPIQEIEEMFDKMIIQSLKAVYLKELIQHFTKYCQMPEEFLSQLNPTTEFLKNLKDPWCFEEDFLGSVEDFTAAYNLAQKTEFGIGEVYAEVMHLEPQWLETFSQGAAVLDGYAAQC